MNRLQAGLLFKKYREKLCKDCTFELCAWKEDYVQKILVDDLFAGKKGKVEIEILNFECSTKEERRKGKEKRK